MPSTRRSLGAALRRVAGRGGPLSKALRRAFWLALAALCLLAPRTRAQAALEPQGQDRAAGVVRFDTGFALLNEDKLLSAFSLGLQGGFRHGAWTALAVLELNTWSSPHIGSKLTDRVAAINFGVGGELVFAGGLARTALALGPSILVVETSVDDSAGYVGVFMDLRPVGLRFALGGVQMGLDPIAFKVIAPALHGIPLIELQYATCIYAEIEP
jgi:hypothetical protein